MVALRVHAILDIPGGTPKRRSQAALGAKCKPSSVLPSSVLFCAAVAGDVISKAVSGCKFCVLSHCDHSGTNDEPSENEARHIGSRWQRPVHPPCPFGSALSTPEISECPVGSAGKRRLESYSFVSHARPDRLVWKRCIDLQCFASPVRPASFVWKCLLVSNVPSVTPVLDCPNPAWIGSAGAPR